MTKIYTMSSVIGAPKRGKHGDAKFPGNCSGLPIKLLLLYFKPKTVLDPMEGSGTCRDVCKELGIKYDGYDLIRGYDMYEMKFEKKYDFIHWHPPYFRFNVDKYRELCSDRRNLAFISNWREYLKKLKEGLDILFDALSKNGVLAVLLGLRRLGGRVYDPASHLVVYKDAKFIGEIIKIQYGIFYKSRFGDSYSKLSKIDEYPMLLGEDLSEENFKPATFHGHQFILTIHEKYILFQNR
ncbi:MAG: hypothetical protein ACTSPL_04175 [Candidatus Odinarchaeia archaeon]